ncbi:helix-turn-helix transcriptional regulator [Myroides sp. M-43]|uniref:helix-turn-helix transcriptional regulator n=1 Tax=Myroides oncorhynchi TaxID=2893756 RepID=UPI001E55AD41|nr:helix-turn-helix transcriptional regulator [Myroides oncorhynchi]MCC9041296.1 helix-turn-helix transcriptional regulator [Myroides oncorhynchi]
MMENYLYILILAAAVTLNGISYFINSRLVSRRKSQQILDKFLLFFITHCVLATLVRFCFEDEVFIYLGMPFGLFYAPFFYCSFRALQLEMKEGEDIESDEVNVIKSSFIHFLPGILFFVAYFLSLFYFETLDVKFLINYYFIAYLILGVQLILYSIFGYLTISKLNVVKHIRLLVLRIIWIMIFVGIVSIGLVVYNAIPNNDGNVLYLGILCLAMTMFFYYLDRLKYEEVLISHGGIIVEQKTEEVEVIEQNKYEKSKFTSEFSHEYKTKIEKVIIKDQLYLKPTCSLEMVEKLTKVQKHHLSQFFSTEYGKHFNAYINELRIDFAKNTLIERNYNVSVNELGEESGFNSRTSFFRAFKKYVGVSPSEYIENQQGQNDKQQ